MTYSAPRRGLFAIIILISFVLNLLLFAINSQKQLEGRQAHAVHEQTLLLSQELAAPLSINDRVSMSVVASRYMEIGDLSFIAIYDAGDNLIMPLGLEVSPESAVSEMITSSTNVLGKVTVHAKPISRAQIISSNWKYLAGMALIHALLWLIYGYIARPTRELCLEIAHNVRNRLLAKGLLEIKHDNHILNAEHGYEHDKQQTDNIAAPKSVSTDQESVSDKNNRFVMQIRFDDPNQLLDTVGQQTKNTYFSLCHQLARKAAEELLKLPIFSGVVIENISNFDDQGCQITIFGQNNFAKSALASVMLARLVLMLNQVVYNKHRELKRFALPVRTYVSDVNRREDVLSVGIKHKESLLVLLPSKYINSLAHQGNFQKISDPRSVAERECRYLKQMSESNVERLEQLRDQVLTSS